VAQNPAYVAYQLELRESLEKMQLLEFNLREHLDKFQYQRYADKEEDKRTLASIESAIDAILDHIDADFREQ
jgi:hypothetical protein